MTLILLTVMRDDRITASIVPGTEARFVLFKGQEGLHSAQPHGDTHSTSATLS